MTVIVKNPFNVFFDLKGQPLEAGKIFIGRREFDPETHPVQIIDQNGNALDQPVRTTAGVPTISGAPINICVAPPYSIKITDKNGVVVYSAARVDG